MTLTITTPLQNKPTDFYIPNNVFCEVRTDDIQANVNTPSALRPLYLQRERLSADYLP